MNKLYRCFCFLISLTVLGFSAPAIAVGLNYPTYDQTTFDNLKEYNILLTGSEQGISSYSGIKGDLRLNFSTNDEEITKINFMFNNDIGEAQRTAIVSEILDVVDNLMPKKIKNMASTYDKLYQKIAKFKSDRDSSVFAIGKLRFEYNVVNDLVNIKVVS